MALIKKLTKIGNSYGVILPSEVLKLAGMEFDSELDVTVEKEGVLIRPRKFQDKRDKRVMEAMARFIKKYRHDLKKLAS